MRCQVLLLRESSTVCNYFVELGIKHFVVEWVTPIKECQYLVNNLYIVPFNQMILEFLACHCHIMHLCVFFIVLSIWGYFLENLLNMRLQRRILLRCEVWVCVHMKFSDHHHDFLLSRQFLLIHCFCCCFSSWSFSWGWHTDRDRIVESRSNVWSFCWSLLFGRLKWCSCILLICVLAWCWRFERVLYVLQRSSTFHQRNRLCFHIGYLLKSCFLFLNFVLSCLFVLDIPNFNISILISKPSELEMTSASFCGSVLRIYRQLVFAAKELIALI